MKVNGVTIPKGFTLEVSCPECLAKEGEECYLARERRDGRTRRKHVHEDRVFAYAEKVKPGSTKKYIEENL